MLTERSAKGLFTITHWGYAVASVRPSHLRTCGGRLAPCLAGLLLSGCGLLPTPPSEEMIEYHSFATHAKVQAASTPAPAAASGRPVVLVSLPLAAVAYESPRMAYAHDEREINYYSRSEWIGPPARLLEPMLVRALEGTGAFRAVTTGTNGLLAELRLDVEIYELIQHFHAGRSEGRVALRVQVIDLAREHLLAARTFSSSAPAPSGDPRGGATAISTAMSNVLSSVAEFVASLAKTSGPPAAERG